MKSVQTEFLHSVLAVAAVALSFGTCTLLWYSAKQKQGTTITKTGADALHIEALLTLVISGRKTFCSIQLFRERKLQSLILFRTD